MIENTREHTRLLAAARAYAQTERAYSELSATERELLDSVNALKKAALDYEMKIIRINNAT